MNQNEYRRSTFRIEFIFSEFQHFYENVHSENFILDTRCPLKPENKASMEVYSNCILFNFCILFYYYD